MAKNDVHAGCYRKGMVQRVNYKHARFN
jgi:hypothetical protein